MGKSSKRKNNKHSYPTLICLECAILAGKKTSQSPSEDHWLFETCSLCGRKMAVTDPKNFGHFSPDNLAYARKKIKEFGFDVKKYAEVDDVRRLIDVITGVLGDNMSYMTKLVIRDIEADMARGKLIDMYATKQLSYWYAKDAEFIQNRKEQEQEESKIIIARG